jgi:hypothetical protein
METNHKITEAAWLAVIAGIITGGGTAFVFYYGYEPILQAMIAADMPESYKMVSFIFPVVTDLGLGATILWAFAAAGFFKHREWAYQIALVGCVMSFLPGFLPLPAMASQGLFPPSPFLVFLPNVLFFFLLTRRIRQVPGWVVTISFLAALSMIWAFINGMACTHRMFEGRGVIYVFSQRIHFVIAAGWCVYSLALLTRRRWAQWLGIATAFAALLFGTPLAIMDMMALGRFSFFGVSPIFGAILMTLMILRKSRNTLKCWADNTSAPERLIGDDVRTHT